MTKEQIMAKIVELQEEISGYVMTEQEIIDELDAIYFELENMEEE